MPQYHMTCHKNLGGCGHTLKFTCLMSELKDKRPRSCPKCRKRKSLQPIFSPPSAQFYNTLGHRADKNSETMSADEKHHLHKEHNAYKEDGKKWVEGPGGRMMRINKDE